MKSLCATLAMLVLTASSGRADVTRIVIDPTKSAIPAYGGRSFGSGGQYQRLVGLAYGELDPQSPRNRLIQDIELAPRNASGKVEYVASFSVIAPLDASRASGLLFYEVVNRGNEGTQRFLAGGAEDGEQFLMSRGAVILRSGWQGDIPADDPGNWGGKTYSIKVPIARHPDGTVITGKILHEFVNVSGSTAPLVVLQRRVPYLPASLETAQARLTSTPSLTNEGKTGPVTTIGSGDWAWADCSATPFPGRPDPTNVCLKHGFNPSLLYRLIFTAKDPLVLGIGFAATRDLVSFFRRSKAGPSSVDNPIAGKITRVIAMGSSQTGQFVRTFIHLGFNQDESGQIVWDGAMPNIAGRQLALNVRFALPDGTATHSVPDGQGPLWWSAWKDSLRGRQAAGLLDRCQATNTCPKIFETFGAAEFWGLRMTPGLVGTTARADIPLPGNVRRYYFPGTTHAGGPGGFNAVAEPPPTSMMGSCTLPPNPNPESDTLRALVLALDDWIVRGTAPPESRYPRLTDGTLVEATRRAMGFPQLAQVPFVDHFANPQFDYDFGRNFLDADVSGVISKLPPETKHVLPALVAKVNADGNEVVGVASVLHQVPLGTYLGWNITSAGFFKGQRCAFVGGFVPFATTAAERLATHDPRPSLEERYGTREEYVKRVGAAARTSMTERHLLPEDADRLIEQASKGPIFRPPPVVAAEPHGTERILPTVRVSYAADIAPVVARQCATCHRLGGSAPFSLASYPDVKGRARQIVAAVKRRSMPPWKPEAGYGAFADVRRLTSDQIALFERWVADGAPAGDLTSAPPPPQPSDGWQLGTPDVVITMPVPYRLPPGGPDRLRNFVMPISASGPRYVRAWEFRSTNTQVVHHATIVVDPTRSSRALDEHDPEPGYEGLIPLTAQNPQGFFLGWTPGQRPYEGPAGTAWRMESDSDLVVMTHLRPTAQTEMVQVSIALYFASEAPSRVPAMIRLNRQDIDIPPGQAQYTVHDSYTLPVDVDVYSVQPHAHNLARQMKALATLPDGSTRWLIYIRDWDFHWQDAYRYASPIALPTGTRLSMEYTYDNSQDNPANPTRPPKRVTFGQGTTDEMADLWIQVVPRSATDLPVLTRSLAAKLLPQTIRGYELMLGARRDEPSLHDDLALLYLQAGNVKRTAEQFAESLRLKPQSPAAHYNFGNALLALGRYVEAERPFRAAMRLDAGYPLAYQGLALSLQAQHKLDDAIAAYKKALALRPQWREVEAQLDVALAARRANR